MFREGDITFSEAIKDTGLSDKDFLEAVQIFAPPIVNMIFDEGGVGKVLSTEPHRTSCPRAIEDLFGDGNVTSTDIRNVLDRGLFPDIINVTHSHEADPARTLIDITFIDETIQLVYLNFKGYSN